MKRVWIRFDSIQEEVKAVQKMAGRVPILGRRAKEYAVAPEHMEFLVGLSLLFYVTGTEGMEESESEMPGWLSARGGAKPPKG